MSTFVNGKGGGITDPLAFKLALGVSAEVQTMQNLRDLDVSTIGTVGFARTTCHSLLSDLGGGEFVWVSSSTDDDNDITTVCPTGRTAPGRWVRFEFLLNPGIISLGWTAARPNIAGLNNAPYFNAAIQELPLYSADGFTIPGGFMRRGILRVPAGEWYVSDTINASQGMAIYGEGANETWIKLNTGATGYQNPSVEKWILYYHRDEDLFYNNVFGSRLKDLTIYGQYQPGSSGVFISGAQKSFCRDVGVVNMGIQGGVFNVPCDEVWVAGCLQGPGFTTNIGPRMNHGVIRCEHVNEDGTYLMELYQNPPSGPVTVNIPRPAFFFDGAYQVVVDHLQGENSFYEVVLNNCVDVVIYSTSSRRVGPTVVATKNSTWLYLFGDTYNLVVNSVSIASPYAVKVFDNSSQALGAGDSGSQTTDFWKNRNGLPTSNVNPTYPGPYANDAAAAASKQVPVGAAYRVTGGTIAWRQT